MSARTMNGDGLKAKKSFTLSRTSLAFLEQLRKRHKARSTSLVLDGLIREAEREARASATVRAVTNYYSSLSPEELSEQRTWGKFALDQIRPEK